MVIGLLLLTCLLTGCQDMSARRPQVNPTAVPEMANSEQDKSIHLGRSPDLMSPQRGGQANERVVAKDPSSVTVGPANHNSQQSFRTGMAHLANKRYADATSEFRKIVLDDPKNTDAWYHLGLTYFEQGKDAAAILPLDQAINRKSDFGEAWLLRGIIKVRQGEFEQAGVDLDRARQFGQSNYNLYLHIAIVDLKRHEYQATIDDATLAIERDASQAYPWFLRCFANARMHRNDAANADYKRMIDLGADDSMIAQVNAVLIVN